MANGDSLRDLIELARRELPGVPPEEWNKLLDLAARHFGSGRLYVNALSRKRARLEMLAQADADASNAKLAELLGVTGRQVRRLKQMR